MKAFLSTQLISWLLLTNLHASPAKQADAFYERGLAAEKRGDLIAADHLFTLATRVLPGHADAQAKLHEFETSKEPATKRMAKTAMVHEVSVYLWPAPDPRSKQYQERSLNAFIANVSSQSGIQLVFEHFDGELRLNLSNITFMALLDEIEKQTGFIPRYEQRAVVLSPGKLPLSEMNGLNLSRNNLYRKVRTSEGVVRQLEGGIDRASSVKIFLQDSQVYLFCRSENIQTAFAGAIPAETIQVGQKLKFTGTIQNNRGIPWIELFSKDQWEILENPPAPVVALVPSAPLNLRDEDGIQSVNPFTLAIWKSKNGKSVKGEFVGLDGEAVVIKRDGKEFTIPFSRLDADSVAQAKRMNEPQAAPKVAADLAVEPPVVEAGTKGITILKALYGSREQFDKGMERDVTLKAQQLVVDGKLYINHTRNAFGDPHPYRGKILKITYLVDGKNAPSGKPYEFVRGGGEITLGPGAETIPSPR